MPQHPSHLRYLRLVASCAELDDPEACIEPCERACEEYGPKTGRNWGSISRRAHLVLRDGIEVKAPPGRKHWGLLAYLVRSEVPSSRERLSGLLFPEADDPLGALRSALSALRRQLGPHAEVGGNPVRLMLGQGAFVDVAILGSSWMEAVSPPRPGPRAPGRHGLPVEPHVRELAGERAPARRRDDRRGAARGGPDAPRPRGRAREARDHAAHLVRLNPFDENAHVLLVRCLAAAGESDAAARQVEACTQLFRLELGVDPEPGAPFCGRRSGRLGRRADDRTGRGERPDRGGRRRRVSGGRPRPASHGSGSTPWLADTTTELLAQSLIGLGRALVHLPRQGRGGRGGAARGERARRGDRRKPPRRDRPARDRLDPVPPGDATSAPKRRWHTRPSC